MVVGKKQIAMFSLGASFLSAAIIAAASYWSPWMALTEARSALARGESKAIEEIIDMQEVRDNMIRDLSVDALAKSGLSSSDERAVELVMAIQNMVDKTITTEKIASLATNSEKSSDKRKIRGAYMSVGRYIFAIENTETHQAVSVRLRRLGPMSWRVDKINFLGADAVSGK
jgi:hypothetical protein